jgi:hypothetical protein
MDTIFVPLRFLESLALGTWFPLLNGFQTSTKGTARAKLIEEVDADSRRIVRQTYVT